MRSYTLQELFNYTLSSKLQKDCYTLNLSILRRLGYKAFIYIALETRRKGNKVSIRAIKEFLIRYSN